MLTRGGFRPKCSSTFSGRIFFGFSLCSVSFSGRLEPDVVFVFIGDNPSGINSLIDEFLLLEPIRGLEIDGILEVRALGRGKFNVIISFLFSSNFDFFNFGSSIISLGLNLLSLVEKRRGLTISDRFVASVGPAVTLTCSCRMVFRFGVALIGVKHDSCRAWGVSFVG